MKSVIYTINKKSGKNFYVAAFHKDSDSTLYRIAENAVGDLSGLHIPRGYNIENMIAYAGFKYQEPKHLFTTDVVVLEAYRRKGIASKMYNVAEKYSHLKIKPSPILSDDAKEFWKQRK